MKFSCSFKYADPICNIRVFRNLNILNSVKRIDNWLARLVVVYNAASVYSRSVWSAYDAYTLVHQSTPLADDLTALIGLSRWWSNTYHCFDN